MISHGATPPDVRYEGGGEGPPSHLPPSADTAARSYGNDHMLEESGILPAGDAARQSALRALAWRMVEEDVLPNGRRQTILSREWIAARGWSVALFLGLPGAEGDALCGLLSSRGHKDFLGTPVDLRMAGDAPSIVWRIPNEPDDEGAPFGNFLLAHAGLMTIVFPEDAGFAFHADEDGDVNILAGPADLIRAATGGDPSAAAARYLARARAFETDARRRFQPEALSGVARQYAPFLLKS